MPVEVKIINKNDEKTLTTKDLHYPDGGVMQMSRDCPILKKYVMAAIEGFPGGLDHTKVVLTFEW